MRKRKAAENAIERRHREKMTRQDRYLDLLERLTSAVERSTPAANTNNSENNSDIQLRRFETKPNKSIFYKKLVSDEYWFILLNYIISAKYLRAKTNKSYLILMAILMFSCKTKKRNECD
ncbi:unnamed protein product [Acanthoscelides obtectus]|uniref:Uncharacterized protein n=1 Tax=Acanthoscelides obtectus TaxID=200917 RepID=A0A9P0Q7F5_ACAOB|nr:unnamed protein product [Acanthoscelides obtectus]CAK1681097.1 hypothetical protein AOBTE_LOCUS33015 [Acanthoscelides obtectus]